MTNPPAHAGNEHTWHTHVIAVENLHAPTVTASAKDAGNTYAAYARIITTGNATMNTTATANKEE